MNSIRQFIKQFYRHSKYNNILEMVKTVCEYDFEDQSNKYYETYISYKNLFNSMFIPEFIFESVLRNNVAAGIIKQAYLHPRFPNEFNSKARDLLRRCGIMA